MDRDEFGALLIGVLVFVVVAFFSGIAAMKSGYRNGYIQCLADAKNGVAPQYRLVEQKNGELKWKEVED